MDLATIVGQIVVFVLIVAAILIGGGSFGAFIDVPSALVVLGGATAATMMCVPLKRFLGLGKVLKNTVFNKEQKIVNLIAQIVSLAETARRDGLLALESRIEEVDNEFVVLGIQMAVDGTRPEVIEDIMRTEIDAVATRHRDGKFVVDQLGRFAPAFGMIGTLLGLIIMLGNMSDPSSIGAGMAVALITTLYGAILSNGIFLPMAEKLSFYNKQELLVMEIVVRGILGIQSGDNPRVIAQKLGTFVPPSQRVEHKKAA